MTDKKTILLIDDEVDLAEAVGFQIKAKTGYEVVLAHDGVEGLEKLETIKPHLILLDMNMPRMGGIEFYNKICDSDGVPKHPVLVLTARANLEQLFIDLNVDCFMTKPFEMDLLLKEIGIIMDKRYGEGAPEPVVEKKDETVLFVEDDQKSYNDISKAFVADGYDVAVAQSGGEVLHKMTQITPSIILIKLGLPGLTGDVIASKFKNMPKTMSIPIIVYTKHCDNLNINIAMKLLKKVGIKQIVEYVDARDLLNGVKQEIS